MNNGYIKIYRKLLDSAFYKNSTYVHLWIHLLLKANHKDEKFMWNGQEKILKEGQFLTGRKRLSKETGIPQTTIERCLDYFEKSGLQIGQQKTNKYRVITILNWNSHQKTDWKADIKRTSNGHQTDTYKNEKNEKNDKKERESINYLLKIPEEDIKYFTSRFDLSSKTLSSKAETLYNYCQAKGRVYKNYYAFLLNAVKKDFPERKPDKKIEDDPNISPEQRKKNLEKLAEMKKSISILQ